MYENGKVFNKDGSEYKGKGVKINKDGTTQLTGFLKDVVGALNTLAMGEEGGSYLTEMQNSTENTKIVRSSDGNSYTPDAVGRGLWQDQNS